MNQGARAPRVLGWAAIVLVFLLMTVGNIVSATGSGLACPDWPLCHGRVIPPLQPDVLIEYSHRLIAVLASVLLVATIVATIRTERAKGPRRVGIALLTLLGVQIGLGGVTVLLKLPHLVSTAHLVNALLILGGLLLLVVRPERAGAPAARGAGRRGEGMWPSEGSRSRTAARLGRVGLGVLLLQLALGGYVRHSGAGLACPDFPLCSGAVLPGHWLAAAHWAHRWLGVTLLGFFIHLAVAARGTRLGRGTAIIVALATLQVALGVAAVVLRLDPPVRALHAAVGYALWGALVWMSVHAGSWPAVRAGTPAIRAQAAEIAHAS